MAKAMGVTKQCVNHLRVRGVHDKRLDDVAEACGYRVTQRELHEEYLRRQDLKKALDR